MSEGFETPELFDSASLEELERYVGFKRDHLEAVENYRNARRPIDIAGAHRRSLH